MDLGQIMVINVMATTTGLWTLANSLAQLSVISHTVRTFAFGAIGSTISILNGAPMLIRLNAAYPCQYQVFAFGIASILQQPIITFLSFAANALCELQATHPARCLVVGVDLAQDKIPGDVALPRRHRHMKRRHTLMIIFLSRIK